MRWRGFAAVLLVLVALPLTADAHDPACDAAGPLAVPTRVLQDDADSGGDAPDAATLAHRIPSVPVSPNGSQGDYYWAWLDPPVARDGADHDDWYVVNLKGNGETVMAGVVSNYTLVYVQTFVLRVFPPGATTPLPPTTSAGGNVTFVNHAPGDLLLHVTTLREADARACASPPDAPETPSAYKLRNHGLYFGCNPICAAAT